MNKTQANCYIDSELYTKAKDNKLSISHILEQALKKKLIANINTEEEERYCYYCEMSRGEMIWDGFLEVWVCPKCNNSQIRKVSIMAKK